jgi:antitoxin ParD1/3/4
MNQVLLKKLVYGQPTDFTSWTLSIISISTTLSSQDLLYLVRIYTIKRKAMGRQSISFTEPNDEWLKYQVESKEYSSKSELVNDLVRQARNQQQEINYIRMKLKKAEKSGFTSDSKEDILRQAKS